ncbi:hypothetical protein F6V25_14320 [Oryzomonas japonica]|uniref:Uncharacterized protein n=1 Tax=Oryzomonas japonica TaxID=2603858 RepID=A0A7J4ZMN4_9BACT|nr:hypothetical protein [Oryzomonas japonica]KAB0663986.1 hypothetical protein F6V25_14320 [Oryzomonas japonica]
MKFRFCAVLLMALFVAGAGFAPAAPAPAAVENWAYTYPDAAFELWSWSRDNPAAARIFSRWDAVNHERSRMIVTWAIAHPGKGIELFLESHPYWADVEQLAGRYRPAARTLLAWCRHYPGAAKALMKSAPKSRVRAATPPARPAASPEGASEPGPQE